MYAEALCLLRKPKEAVAELTKILEQHPDDVQSYERMGILANDYPDVVSKPAAFWFDEAIAKNPQSALAYIARAEFHLRNSRGDEALADLEQAQKCDLPDTETRGRLVGGLMDTRLLDQAKEPLKAAQLLDQAREQLKAWQAKDPTEPVLWQCWTVLASRANGLALRAKDPAVLARSVEEMYTVAAGRIEGPGGPTLGFHAGRHGAVDPVGPHGGSQNCIAQMQQKDIAPQVTPYWKGFSRTSRAVARRDHRLAQSHRSRLQASGGPPDAGFCPDPPGRYAIGDRRASHPGHRCPGLSRRSSGSGAAPGANGGMAGRVGAGSHCSPAFSGSRGSDLCWSFRPVCICRR